MRVYGASPLYNYVELIFRSKRMFIISIVLATLIVSTLATLRGRSYTASAMILLTGRAESSYQNTDESQLGSVKYKVNLLTIFLKDPEFMKSAIKSAIAEQTHSDVATQHVWPDTGLPVEYHFDTNMTDVAFDKFCKDARQALNFAQGEGILELTCRWPDSKAADILDAFFWEYHDRVVSHETVNSEQSETMLSKLLAEYISKEKSIEKNIVKYQKDHINNPPENPEGASSNLKTMQNALEEMRLSISMAQQRRDTYAQQLKSIPAKIVSAEVLGGPQSTPAYQAALRQRNDRQQALDELKSRYQDTHPKVREAQRDLDTAEAELAKAEKAGKAGKNVQSSTEVVNPDFVRTQAMVNQADADLQGLKANYALRQKQVDDERQRALQAGSRNYEFKWLTDEYGIIGTIRTNLENRLQAAQLAKRQELQRSSAETTMVVKPVSEAESAGGKSLLLYAAGPILGLIIAFAFSLVAETLDHSLRTPIEVEKHLGKPVLAVLPRMDPPKPSRRKLGGGGESRQATLPPA
jgi:uncharacterized protein involved in exopolysaccharide biosynthesis